MKEDNIKGYGNVIITEGLFFYIPSSINNSKWDELFLL